MNAMNHMRLTAVQIRNYKGIKDGRYPLGKSVTVISGENETAKTTIVDALMDGLGGGDISWRKNKKGDKPPEIDIEVNDGVGNSVCPDVAEALVRANVGTAAERKTA